MSSLFTTQMDYWEKGLSVPEPQIGGVNRQEEGKHFALFRVLIVSMSVRSTVKMNASLGRAAILQQGVRFDDCDWFYIYPIGNIWTKVIGNKGCFFWHLLSPHYIV